jgi:hypothetical protein
MGRHTVPSGFTLAKRWIAPANATKPRVTISIESPRRTDRMFSAYRVRLGLFQAPYDVEHIGIDPYCPSTCNAAQTGLGGSARVFSPEQSYWALEEPQGGGASTYKAPTGLVQDDVMARRHWSKPQTGVVHAFHVCDGYPAASVRA